MLHMQWIARKTPEWHALKDEKSYYQEHGFVKVLEQLFWKLDVIGVLLMGCSLGCILVPLTLAGGVKTTWNDSRLIGPFVLGFVLIPILWVWEYRVARDPIIPYKLVKDRGVWSSMGISFLIEFHLLHGC